MNNCFKKMDNEEDQLDRNTITSDRMGATAAKSLSANNHKDKGT